MPNEQTATQEQQRQPTGEQQQHEPILERPGSRAPVEYTPGPEAQKRIDAIKKDPELSLLLRNALAPTDGRPSCRPGDQPPSGLTGGGVEGERVGMTCSCDAGLVRVVSFG